MYLPTKYQNLAVMQKESCEQYSQSPISETRTENGWTSTSYASFGQSVIDCRSGLKTLGVEKGDTVAIIARNSMEWIVIAYASLGLGARYTAMYESQTTEDMVYIAGNSRAKVIFCWNDHLVERLTSHQSDLPEVEHIVNITAESSDNNSFKRLLLIGSKNEVPISNYDAESIATIIYTSGTTGKPKGVTLSHNNILNQIGFLKEGYRWTNKDKFLSILPWAHVLGQVGEVHMRLYAGWVSAICAGPESLLVDFAEAKPTVLLGVPTIYNKIYSGVKSKLAKAPSFIQRAVKHALDTRLKQYNQIQTTLREKINLKIIDKFLFSSIRKKFGGKMRMFLCGGAALDAHVCQFFLGIGIPIYEGYGLSETSPVVVANTPFPPGHFSIGTAGKPVPGLSIKIDHSNSDYQNKEEGEILVKGHAVMKGYLDLPEENEKIMTEDGYLRTGDIGVFNKDGFLRITGRIKQQFKLLNGKYVMPALIEEKMCLDPLCDFAFVTGNNREFTVCLLNLNYDNVINYFTTRQIMVAADRESLANDQNVIELGANIIRTIDQIKSYERPKHFHILFESWNIENGILTPSMKLKRTSVEEKYAHIIGNLYDNQDHINENIKAKNLKKAG